jgi:outer membrane protein assembly factor BamB
VYFTTPTEGVHAVDLASGRVLWRRGVPRAGDLTAPTLAGPYLMFSGGQSGIYVVDRQSGELVQTFFPGRGICAPPTLDPERGAAYVLSNGGWLYGLELVLP